VLHTTYMQRVCAPVNVSTSVPATTTPAKSTSNALISSFHHTHITCPVIGRTSFSPPISCPRVSAVGLTTAFLKNRRPPHTAHPCRLHSNPRQPYLAHSILQPPRFWQISDDTRVQTAHNIFQFVPASYLDVRRLMCGCIPPNLNPQNIITL
jgi:hypothetical protein